MKTSALIQSCTIGVCSIFFLQGCSTTTPASSTVPVPSPRVDSTSTKSPSINWEPAILPGKWRYLIQDSSTVSINNDTTTRVEPIESVMHYTMGVTDSGGTLFITGQVDSLLVNSRLPGKVKTDTSVTVTFHNSISKRGHLGAVASVDEKNCTGGNAFPVSRISELVITLPVHSLKVGDRWSDTSSTTTCHGKIPLMHRAVREYELVDLTSCNHDGVRVQRVVSDTFTGSSTESTNHLSASGSGTSRSILCLDRNTGILLTSDGQSRIELVVTTTRGVFPFTQKTSTHITTQ